jgi:hypothetical protein
MDGVNKGQHAQVSQLKRVFKPVVQEAIWGQIRSNNELGLISEDKSGLYQH